MSKAQQDFLNAANQKITDGIIESLEKGVLPWRKSWNGKTAASGFPYNANSKRAYRGMNVIWLWMQGMIKGYTNQGWMTYDQATTLGGHVRKGEKSTMVELWNFTKKLVTDEKTGEEKLQKMSFQRFFNVFNVEQIDGLPEKFYTNPDDVKGTTGQFETDIAKAGVKTKFGGDDACYYGGTLDYIQMPVVKDFNTENDYYATWMHEVTHWTGHEKRLNRKADRRHSYAFEELVAEIGSAFIGNHYGIEPKGLGQPEYIAYWLTILKGDNMAIRAAASQAQKAFDFVLEGQIKSYEEKPEAPKSNVVKIKVKAKVKTKAKTKVVKKAA